MPLNKEQRELLRKKISEEKRKLIGVDSKGRMLPRPGRRYNKKGEVKSVNYTQKRVFDDDGNILIHGTSSAYNKGRCRCPECSKKKSETNAKRFKRPCINNCGNNAWISGGNSGMCAECRKKERRANIKKFKAPCINGCGNDAWHGIGKSGRCIVCYKAERKLASRSATQATSRT